jgi:hypothetical protein
VGGGIFSAASVGKCALYLKGRLRELNPQEVSNAMHGLSKLGGSCGYRLDDTPGLAAAIAAAVRAAIGSYTPQNLANAAWAAAKLMERAGVEADRAALDFYRWDLLFCSTLLRRLLIIIIVIIVIIFYML